MGPPVPLCRLWSQGGAFQEASVCFTGPGSPRREKEDVLLTTMVSGVPREAVFGLWSLSGERRTRVGAPVLVAAAPL